LHTFFLACLIFFHPLANHSPPLDSDLNEIKVLVVNKGDSLRKIASKLANQGIIKNKVLFEFYARVYNLDKEVKSGEYYLSGSQSIQDILSDLSIGSVISNRITFPEGTSSYQIVDILRKVDSLVGTIAKVPPEGSLAPNTYFYSNGQSRELVLEQMKSSQRSILKRTWQTRQENLVLKTPEELMILASIVEKESGNDSERVIIASVLHNRLKNNMRLQADPTVIYGITRGKGSLGRRLLKSDLKKTSVYNTYMIDGLPKTPICNPGEASLWAAANPVSTNYFYYVANGKGGHAFAETLEEHNKNVRVWRKLRNASTGN
jgi:UPF0755 protein